jgi:hypothetical protein
MGVNEENCISCYLSNIIKGVSCYFLLTPCLPLVNTLASYRIGSNPVGLESTPSFVEANYPLSLYQGKDPAYTLYRFFLYNLYLMSMIVHISIGI